MFISLSTKSGNFGYTLVHSHESYILNRDSKSNAGLKIIMSMIMIMITMTMVIITRTTSTTTTTTTTTLRGMVTVVRKGFVVFSV
jgi:hypothetical protein